jgi:Holliday junction resolvase RusA-like endonuclease
MFDVHMTSGDNMTTGRQAPFRFWVDGAPFSKANQRQIVNIGGRPTSIKSAKALAYADVFRRQCPQLPDLFEGDVHVDLDIYYPDRRRDLDESLVLDLMQGLIYVNDRQVKSRRVRWGLRKEKPGIDIYIRPAESSDYAQPISFPAAS